MSSFLSVSRKESGHGEGSVCPVCGIVVTRWQMAAHLTNKHNDNVLKCEQCPYGRSIGFAL